VSQIDDLQARVRKLNIEKGWRGALAGSREGYEFPAYIALLHSEASEALEAYRDKIWSDTMPRRIHEGELAGAGKPIGVGPELADVFIRILDMCDIWGIDLEYEVHRVLQYGQTRPYRHGGRIL